MSEYVAFQIVSRFEDGGPKHYLVDRWPAKIMCSQVLLEVQSDLCWIDGDKLHFAPANGFAIYREIKADDFHWYGELQPGSKFTPAPA
jgi:hypothetical protein